MKWYLKVVRDNYANFDGRARREEYWMFVLFNLLITFGLLIVGGILGAIEAALFETGFLLIFTYIVFIMYSIGIFIPSIAVAVRRLHDQNLSGTYYFVSFIPFIGGIWMLILMITEGTPGPNKYGHDPKRPLGENIYDTLPLNTNNRNTTS